MERTTPARIPEVGNEDGSNGTVNVTVLVLEGSETFELTTDELSELEAALDEIARGESIDGASLVRELGSRS